MQAPLSELSMQYMCSDADNNEHSYRVAHKGHPDKFRLVVIDPLSNNTASCSCRKQIWHGIICRHIIRTFRHLNFMSLPIEMFNQRWMSEYVELSLHSIMVDRSFASNLSSTNKKSEQSEDHRIAELSAISKNLILRSVSQESTYTMVRSTLLSMIETVKESQNIRQSHEDEDDLQIRNPLKVRTKGRPKTGEKRYVSVAEQQRSKRKKNKSK